MFDFVNQPNAQYFLVFAPPELDFRRLKEPLALKAQSSSGEVARFKIDHHKYAIKYGSAELTKEYLNAVPTEDEKLILGKPFAGQLSFVRKGDDPKVQPKIASEKTSFNTGPEELKVRCFPIGSMLKPSIPEHLRQTLQHKGFQLSPATTTNVTTGLNENQTTQQETTQQEEPQKAKRHKAHSTSHSETESAFRANNVDEKRRRKKKHKKEHRQSKESGKKSRKRKHAEDAESEKIARKTKKHKKRHHSPSK